MKNNKKTTVDEGENLNPRIQIKSEKESILWRDYSCNAKIWFN